MEHAGRMEKCTHTLSRKTSGKRIMVRPKRREEYKIKISFTEFGRQIVYLGSSDSVLYFRSPKTRKVNF
jgi:hypothetical protein